MSRISFVAGLLLGGGVTFLLDPRQGARRRALIRDKGSRALHEVEDAARVGARDLGNRAAGIKEEIKAALEPKTLDERSLRERVRAELGRVCTHTSGIDVEAHGSHVTLRGPVLASEMSRVLRRAARVRGVADVENALEPHDEAEHVPALQGAHRVTRRRMRPATLFVLGVASAAGAIAAVARGSIVGFALGGLGAAAAITRIEHRHDPRRSRARVAPAITSGTSSAVASSHSR